MKRFLSILLALMMILCGCNVTDIENNSLDDGLDSSDEGLENSSNENPENISGVPVIISNGKPYKTSVAPGENYPDSYSCELTNGASNRNIINYTDNALSGYSGGSLSVTVDLEQNYDNIRKLEAYIYLEHGAGISYKMNTTASASDDGQNWTHLGELTIENITLKSVNKASLKLSNVVSARYIKFTFNGNAAWVFLDDVSVIAYYDKSDKLSYEKLVADAYSSLGTVSTPSSENKVDPNESVECVSLNRSYSITAPALSKFPDDKKRLTDGKTGRMIEDSTWIGLQGGTDVDILLDLGSERNDILSFELNCLANNALDIYLPTAVTITAISASNEITPLGIVYGNPNSTDGNYRFVFALSNTVSAKYIKFTLHTVENTKVFIDEVFVFAISNGDGGFYPPIVLNTDEPESKSDSTKYENLILGKPAQIGATTAVPTDSYKNNSRDEVELLTDGEYSSSYDIHNGEYFKFHRAERRKIVFDLEQISAVDCFKISFTAMTEWAIYAPSNVSVIASENGTEWYEVGKIYPKTADIQNKKQGELLLSQKLRARYIAFAFDVSVWSGVDEIEVLGTKSNKNAISISENTSSKLLNVSNGRIEPSETLLGGAKDLCLLYHGYKLDGYTVDDLMPYLTYVDHDGNPTDTMFDSFVFLYANTEMPSGVEPHKETVWTDWLWCIDDLFADGQNISALEKAAGIVKQKLGLADDFKYKVTVTLYYPNKGSLSFGDVDGDGTVENLSRQEDRIKAIKAYIERIEKRFAEADFQNIDFVGYYWWHEEVARSESDRQLLRSVSELVHDVEKDFFWIPWFCAPGYDDWKDLGFDIACMQPNYVFETRKPYSNLVNNALLTAQNGMGVEMEISAECLVDKTFFKRYMEYITAGVKYGYMDDTVNMYYQSRFIYRDAAFSDSVMARTVYDMTYHYIKGDLITMPEPIEKLELTAEKNKIFFGDFRFDSDKMREFRLYSSPEHGSVTVNADGSFCFFPEKDFVGKVEFSFVYSEYLFMSSPCTVVIDVQ